MGWTRGDGRTTSNNVEYSFYSGYLGFTLDTSDLPVWSLSSVGLGTLSDFTHASSILVACVVWILALCYIYIVVVGKVEESGSLNLPIASVAFFIG